MFKFVYFSVTKRILLFEAAIIWTFAGTMLLVKGSTMLEASSGFSWLRIISCIISGLIFFLLIFSRLSQKHIKRISNLDGDHHWFYEFFNTRSYLMMLSMILLGVILRTTSVVPMAFLSLAYITMGIPLLFSSFRFYYSWIRYQTVNL